MNSTQVRLQTTFFPSDILTTKLFIPHPTPHLISRPRLLTQMQQVLSHSLTLVSAPAGFGKSTLISDWLGSQPELKVAWLGLDPEDNDLYRFWKYVLAAFELAQPGLVSRELALLDMTQNPDLTNILTGLINTLGTVQNEWVLVLDDYHLIEIPALHSGLTFLLDHLPPRLHLVIISRADPPLPLARLRARARLLEIRSPQLRFTLTEAARFLQEQMGLALSVEEVERLDNRIEGWIAGLQLVALALQNRSDPDQFLTAFSGTHRFVAGYLVEDVLSQQPEEVQNFLLQTSILDRFSPALCEAITGQKAEKFLAHLEAANLFVIPLDEQGRWYRYHHLFNEALRHRLEFLQPELVPILNRQAWQWYEKQEQAAEAVRYALAAGDQDEATRLMELAAEAVWKQSSLMLLRSWLERLPTAVVLKRPKLCLYHAWSLYLSGDTARAAQRMEELETLAISRQISDEIKGAFLALKGHYARVRNELFEALPLTEQALELLPARLYPVWRGLALVNLAMLHRIKGDLPLARQVCLEVAGLRNQLGDNYVTLLGLTSALEIEEQLGQLHSAWQNYSEAHKRLSVPPLKYLPVNGYLYLGMARIAYQWGKLELAQQYLTEALECGKQGDLLDIIWWGKVLQAWLLHLRGDKAGALALIGEVEELISKLGIEAFTEWVVGWRVRLWLEQGQLEAATKWAEQARAFHRLENFKLMIAWPHQATPTIFIRLALAQKKPEEALALIDQLSTTIEESGQTALQIELLILQALALQASDRTKEALVVLNRALGLAQAEDYIQLFVNEGSKIAVLLQRACREQAGQTTFIDKLLETFAKIELNPAQLAMPGEIRLKTKSETVMLAGGILEQFSERELEVLGLIAEGLDNEAIAKRLIITVNTVKAHLKTLYSKLGVHSRTQAIAQARNLGLL
jgi:LuxR family maltose regulon positive regulatory protein